jgi:hypothetical protein
MDKIDINELLASDHKKQNQELKKLFGIVNQSVTSPQAKRAAFILYIAANEGVMPRLLQKQKKPSKSKNAESYMDAVAYAMQHKWPEEQDIFNDPKNNLPRGFWVLVQEALSKDARLKTEPSEDAVKQFMGQDAERWLEVRG